jgi:hypothetical protein
VGSDFLDGAQILVNGAPLATQFVSSVSVRCTIDISVAGTRSITVVNPGGVASSNSLTFEVIEKKDNPIPVITGIAPSPVLPQTATLLTVAGSGFITGAVVKIDNAVVTYNVISPAQITVNAPALAIGNHTLEVTNPQPGGGTATRVFLVGLPQVDVQVTVRDVTNGAIIPNATVVINGVSQVANAQGVVTFTAVPTGTRSIQLTAAGFIGRNFSFPINSLTTTLTLRMYPTSMGVDTDGDGIPDSAENNTGIFISMFATGSNPNVADSDGDGLVDGSEVLDGP